MMQLKNYQLQCLDSLEGYFKRCGEYNDAKKAFIHHTNRGYQDVRQLPGVPYICLRLPTGGGKTLLACHSVGIAAKEYLHTDKAICLWLVPSNTIRDQTLRALRERQHPYRQAVDARFGASVTVLDIYEALALSPPDATGGTVIIVSTLAALRVEDTDGRKVYETNGTSLMAHFTGLNPSLEAVLEKDESGAVVKSLANVLRLHRPIVIMDEAHNARTPLSFDTLARIRPSCIIEYTATPETLGDNASNVLDHISAAQLKVENMIKLPIKLRIRADWKEAITDAIQVQRRLEQLAQQEETATGEYIRPIVLLQAQPKNKTKETLTVEVVKKCLVEQFKIPEAQVAIAVGEKDEIEGVNLFEKKCEIRYIITVQKLKEGWDCSQAYVLCTVNEISTGTAVEQILGRILRLPNAKRKVNEELNYAHAIATSPNFVRTAQGLEQALIENGFMALEARDFIQPMGEPTLDFPVGPLWGSADHVSEPLGAAPELATLDADLQKSITFNSATRTLTLERVLSAPEEEALTAAVKSPKDKLVVARTCARLRERAQAKAAENQAASMTVPRLGIVRDKHLELFEEIQSLEYQWSLADAEATVTEQEFPTAIVTGQAGIVDVDTKGKIEYHTTEELREEIALLYPSPTLTVAQLIKEIDRAIPHPDIPWEQAVLFIRKLINGLLERPGINLEVLNRRRFKLRDVIAWKIDAHRRAKSQEAWKTLFGPNAIETVVSLDLGLVMSEENYAPDEYYDGSFKYKKHKFRKIGQMDSHEEQECAAEIDQIPEVKSWVRNIARRPTSFWLPTSTDKFYPDFVVELLDGRYFIVEYKNDRDWSNDDSKEKRDIGELYADKSSGKCLFIMLKGKEWDAIKRVVGFQNIPSRLGDIAE